MKEPVQLAIKATLLLVVLACGYLAVSAWRSNSAEIRQAETRVTRALNEVLALQKVDRIDRIAFPEASRLAGVPEELGFSRVLFVTERNSPGRQRVGMLEGSYNRVSGELEAKADFEGRNDLTIKGTHDDSRWELSIVYDVTEGAHRGRLQRLLVKDEE